MGPPPDVPQFTTEQAKVELRKLFLAGEGQLTKSGAFALALAASTPPNIMEHISQDFLHVYDIRLAVAANPNTPSKTLEKFSRSHRAPVLEALARNPNLPEKIIITLIKKGDKNVHLRLCMNKSTPERLQLILAQSNKVEVLEALAENPNQHACVLDKLASHRVSLVRLGVANNVNTPAKTLDRLLDDTDYIVRGLAIANPNFGNYQVNDDRYNGNRHCRIDKIYDRVRSDTYMKRSCVKNPNFSFHRLSREEILYDAGLIKAAAGNPNLPIPLQSMLMMLHPHNDRFTLESLAGNTSLHHEHMKSMSGLKYRPMHIVLSNNPSATEDILDGLVHSHSNRLRNFFNNHVRIKISLISRNQIYANVAKHANCSEPTVMKLSEDKALKVRVAAASSEKLPLGRAVWLLKNDDSDRLIKDAVCANPVLQRAAQNLYDEYVMSRSKAPGSSC